MKKIKEKIKVNRITNHSLINLGKKEFLLNHFQEVKKIKNQISLDMFNYIQNMNNIEHKFSYKFLLKDYLNSLNQNILTKNELQKVVKTIGIFYEEYLKRVTQNKIFKIQDDIKIKYYSKSSIKFNYKKGDVKSFNIILKKTLTTNLIQYIKYISIQELKDKSFNFNTLMKNLKKDLSVNNKEFKLLTKENIDNKNNKKIKSIKTKITKLNNKLETYNLFNNQLNKFYDNKQLFNQMIKLIQLFQNNLKSKIKLIELSTGSYIKIPIFNKNKVDKNGISKSTKHSYVFKDDSNNKFKYWYLFKTPEKDIYIPLSYNQSYHNNFDKYLLDKETYVSLSPTNKININLNVIVEEPIFLVDTKSKLKSYKREKHIIGIDLNVRDNFLVYFNKSTNKSIEYDYNRQYINDFVNELLKLDKLSESDKKLQINKNKLEKLVRINEWYFKKLISQILKDFQKNKIYEIVMEDLDLSKTSASFVKSPEFQIKYSRLIRMLRLSSIKDWFKIQGEKLGIKVHLVNPGYTSQECSICHYIDNLNRDGSKFKCKNCNHSEHSDSNSPKTILNRCLEDVLLNKFSDFDEYERLVPNKINHKTIKTIIMNNYGHNEELVS